VNIIVCVKPVPDPGIISVNPHTGAIENDDLVYIINPCDKVAIEEAVRIKEKNGEAHITLISVAHPSMKRLLRKCMDSVVDKAMLIWDKDFDRLDSFATGILLAGIIGTLDHDLILCGQKALDTEAGQVGSVIAESLQIPLASRIVSVHVSTESKKLDIQSKLEKGNREKAEVGFPAVLTVETDLNEPRYASLPSLMDGLRKDIKEYDLKAFGLSYEEIVGKDVKTQTVGLATPKPRPKKIFTPDSQLSADERMRLIMSGGVTQKQSDVLKGDPKNVASTIIQFLNEKKFLSSPDDT
jgi:electron transfer flavoprotein beta subunit